MGQCNLVCSNLVFNAADLGPEAMVRIEGGTYGLEVVAVRRLPVRGSHDRYKHDHKCSPFPILSYTYHSRILSASEASVEDR